MPSEIWHCPQCKVEFDLSKSPDREHAIVDLLTHVLGVHAPLSEQK